MLRTNKKKTVTAVLHFTVRYFYINSIKNNYTGKNRLSVAKFSDDSKIEIDETFNPSICFPAEIFKRKLYKKKLYKIFKNFAKNEKKSTPDNNSTYTYISKPPRCIM